MTVIAYDKATLACDSRESISDTPLTVPTKLLFFSFEGRCFVAGLCGSPGGAYAVIRHYLIGAKVMDRPVPMNPYYESGVLLIEFNTEPGKWKATRLSGECGLTDVTHIPWAQGSGADYAMGAMHAGASAEQAAEIACGLDKNCAGPINSIPLVEWNRAVSDGIGIAQRFPPFTTT